MTVRIWGDDLLELARNLQGAQKGRPRNTTLRRAVSTAYYAVYHSTMLAACDWLFSASARATDRYRLAYRNVSHKHLATLCRDLSKRNIREKYQEYIRQPLSSEFVDYARFLKQLQEQRHLADYDPFYRISRNEAVVLVQGAGAAIDTLRNLTDNEKAAFFSLLMFSPRYTEG